MSYPILYSATETNFDHNGIGILSACVSCEVVEEANGQFELTMQYPMDGIHMDEISDREILKAKADQFRDPQLFRIYAISKPMSGIVTILAQHISYDLSGIPVRPFSAETAKDALSGLKNNAVVECPFDFWTNLENRNEFRVDAPASIRSRLGGNQGSVLDTYGGEYEFDNYTVKLHNYRGLNRGVSIRYGKNLTDIRQDQNCSNVATGIYPYWFSGTEDSSILVELPEKTIDTPGNHNFVKIITVDFSEVFEVQPSVDELREAANQYIAEHNLGSPMISLSISYAQLEKSEEYRHLKLLERVSLFDTVNVEFPLLGVSSTAKAVKIIYDVLAERVKSVTLGSVRANIADTIANQKIEIEKKPSKTFMQAAIESLTNTILGARGGSVRLIDENGDGEPDTLYIADNPNPTEAVKVWRFNYEGWGASENGYYGPFKIGATLDGGIVADFITAGTLYGLLFKAGAIESLDGQIKIDLNSGDRALFNSGITSTDLAIRPEGSKADLLRVFVDSGSETDSDPYLSFVGRYDNGEDMFRLGSNAISPGEPQQDIGCSISAWSSGGSAQISSNVNGNTLQFYHQPSGQFCSLSQHDDGMWLTLGLQEGSRRLSWQYSQELGKYVLCGE